MDTKNHWERIYEAKAPNEVSWFQPYPKTSMEFVTQSHLLVEANILDIGGGDSIFLDALLQKRYKNIWVLDISEKAIERSKQRLGVAAGKVNWLLLFNEAAD